jgi:CheY-like chemotaxis protein
MQTILYVDDHADSLELGRALLETDRRMVIGAGTGQDALALAMERRPDLIVLDLLLPDVGGLVVLQLLKEEVQTRAIPVIVVSAANIEDEPAFQRELVAAYLMKPVDPREFRHLVDRTLAGLPDPDTLRWARGGRGSDVLYWRCAACDAGWVRPKEDPLHPDQRCLRCDGVLVSRAEAEAGVQSSIRAIAKRDD